MMQTNLMQCDAQFFYQDNHGEVGSDSRKEANDGQCKASQCAEKAKRGANCREERFEAVKKAHDAVTEAKEKHGEAIYRREQASFDVELYAAMMLSLGGNVAVDNINPYKQKKMYPIFNHDGKDIQGVSTAAPFQPKNDTSPRSAEQRKAAIVEKYKREVSGLGADDQLKAAVVEMDALDEELASSEIPLTQTTHSMAAADPDAAAEMAANASSDEDDVGSSAKSSFTVETKTAHP